MPPRTTVAAQEPRASPPRPGDRLARGAAAAAVLALSAAAAFAVSHRPLWALAAGLLAVVVAAAAARLPFAVAILVASFYFDSYLAVGVGVVTVGKLLGLLAAAAWFLRWSVARRPVAGDPLLWPLAGLAAWIPLSVSTAYDQPAGLTAALRYLTFFTLAFLVVQAVDGDRRTATRMVDVAVAAGAASALVGLYNFFSVSGDGRAHGPLSDPNDFAFVLAVTVPLALHRARSAARPLHRALAAMLAAILASFSRSALVGLAVAGAWAAATRRLPLRSALLAVAGLLAVALVSFLLQPERVESALLEKRHVAQSNIDTRLVAWRVALEEFGSSPVLGVGPGNFEVRFDEFELPPDAQDGPLATHNAYLSVLAELGAPGLALFLAYLAMAWSRLRRRLPGDQDADALQSALAGGFVVAMVGAVFLTEQFYAPLWLLPAIGATLAREPPAGRVRAERAG